MVKTFKDHMFTFPFLDEEETVLFVKNEHNEPIPLTEDGEEWCYFTCQVWGYVPEHGCVFIDHNTFDYGIVSAMVDAGYIELTGRKVPSGFVQIHEGKFNKEWLASLPTIDELNEAIPDFDDYCKMWEEDKC